MRVLERRLDVKLISPDLLVRYMEYRGPKGRPMTLQELADAVTLKGVKTSKSTIGHLTTGHVKTTLPERAKAIAEVLDVPVDVLFVDEVSIVQRDVPPRRRAGAAGRDVA